jgi:hypothetical protein
MKLYHFTLTQNLLLVSWSGLKPQPDALGECGTWRAGRPVVWLTRQESNAATAADVEHYARLDIPVVLGEPLFGGPERVTVHLERHDRKLVRYAEIASEIEKSVLRPHNLVSWWVYFDHIPPSKIEPITVAQAIVGLDIHIDIAHDFEVRARYTAMRAELSLQNADRPVTWDLTETDR